MVEQPLGLVEVGRLFGPVLVVGLEPDGPLARLVTGEQPRQLGSPDGAVGGRCVDCLKWAGGCAQD